MGLDQHPFESTYSSDPPRMFRERNRLLALKDWHLADEEDVKTLEQLQTDFQNAIDTVSNRTGEDPTVVAKNIDSALLCGVAQNLHEAVEILIEGPIITGFETTQDPSFSNQQIGTFLKFAFGEPALRRARIGQITKDDLYIMYKNNQKNEHILQGNELCDKGLIHWDHGWLAAETKGAYLQAELYLEGIDDPSKLQHLYKIRASTGSSNGYETIDLHSFGIEQPEDYEYLRYLPLDRDGKMRAYMLGTLSHEVAHRCQKQLTEESLAGYRQIITEEVGPDRSKYVSDYVRRHKEVYGSSDDMLLGEDLAEAVRIYTTNPDFLKNHYPRRFVFIAQHMPFIKPGSVVEAIKFFHP